MGKKIVIGIFVVVLIGVASAFIFFKSGSKTAQQQTTVPTEEANEQVVKEVDPSEIGLKLTPRSDGKAITMSVTKISDIKSLEYEATYDAQVQEGKEKLTVGRGVGPSTIEIKPGEKSITREILLGSCSRNVCKYDLGVSRVEFVIKINYENGEVGSVSQHIEF